MNVLDLILPPQRDAFEELLREVDSGTPVSQHFAPRVGNGGKPLLVHTRIDRLPSGIFQRIRKLLPSSLRNKIREKRRRAHVIYDLTKAHHFDLVWPLWKGDHRSDEARPETLVYVKINFEDLIVGLDEKDAGKLLRDYNERIRKVIMGCGGVPAGLYPLGSRSRSTLVCMLRYKERPGHIHVDAARKLLDELNSWRGSRENQAVTRLTAYIFVDQNWVEIVDDKAPAPFLTVRAGAEVTNGLTRLDECTPGKIGVSQYIYDCLQEEASPLRKEVVVVSTPQKTPSSPSASVDPKPTGSSQSQADAEAPVEGSSNERREHPRGKPGSAPRIFISHLHDDQLIADALADLLRRAFHVAKGDIRCTSLPGSAISPGKVIPDELRSDIEGAELVLAILAPDTFASAWVSAELAAAWGLKVTTFPLLVRGASREHIRPPLLDHSCISLETLWSCLQLVNSVAQSTSLIRKDQESLPEVGESADRLASAARGKRGYSATAP